MSVHSTKRVVVTGDWPVSRAVASLFVSRDARVVVMCPKTETPWPNAVPVECGFGSEDEVASAVAEAERSLGGIDTAVHGWMAAGLTEPQDFETIDETAWRASCERSLEGAWWWSRQILRPLRATGSATMVYLVPSVGLTGAARFAMMSAVSEGIRVLAKGVGRQTGTQGITVHTIAASPQHWLPAAEDGSLHRAISLSVPALGGPGDPADDLAPLVAMLDSADGHFWTSGTLVADGGVWMAL